MEMLRLKSSGPLVRRLQHGLRQFGFRIEEDGQFGMATGRAVRRFQRKRALVPDGIVGPATVSALGLRGITHNAATSGGDVPGHSTQARASGAPDTSAGGPSDVDAAVRAGPAKTGAALGALAGKVGGAAIPHANQALYVEPKPDTPCPVKSLHMSQDGRDWHESEKRVSNHLYWPTVPAA